MHRPQAVEAGCWQLRILIKFKLQLTHQAILEALGIPLISCRFGRNGNIWWKCGKLIIFSLGS